MPSTATPTMLIAEERRAWLTLLRAPGLGPSALRALVASGIAARPAR